MDIGRLTSSFVLNYISWLGRTDIDMDTRVRMQAYNLKMIKELFTAFELTFKSLWKLYSTCPGDGSEECDAILRDALNYATLTPTIRVTSDYARSCDIRRIPTQKDLALVQQRTFEVAEYTLLNQDKFHNINDFCDFLQCCCDITFQ